MFLWVGFEHVVEELQDEVLLFLWEAFYFLKSSFERRNWPGLFLGWCRLVIGANISMTVARKKTLTEISQAGERTTIIIIRRGFNDVV